MCVSNRNIHPPSRSCDVRWRRPRAGRPSLRGGRLGDDERKAARQRVVVVARRRRRSARGVEPPAQAPLQFRMRHLRRRAAATKKKRVRVSTAQARKRCVSQTHIPRSSSASTSALRDSSSGTAVFFSPTLSESAESMASSRAMNARCRVMRRVRRRSGPSVERPRVLKRC